MGVKCPTMMRLATLLFVLLSTCWCADGHGRLVYPPSRSSMWRYGYRTPRNYNDMELFCGGLDRQQKNGGRCGVCGDAWDAKEPRDNERGGRYATGTVSATFGQGCSVNSTVQITANHKGYFEFKVCPVTENSTREVTQQCLDRFPLRQDGPDDSGYKYVLPTSGNGFFTVTLKLPPNLACKHCVFQWTYITGNNWGTCEDGTGKIGCGPQETFRGCADIEIRSGNQNTVAAPTTTASPPRGTTTDRPEEGNGVRRRPRNRFRGSTSQGRNGVEATTIGSTTESPADLQGSLDRPNCRAVGVFARNPNMGAWCETNCNHVPSFCPQSHCSCSQQ